MRHFPLTDPSPATPPGGSTSGWASARSASRSLRRLLLLCGAGLVWYALSTMAASAAEAAPADSIGASAVADSTAPPLGPAQARSGLLSTVDDLLRPVVGGGDAAGGRPGGGAEQAEPAGVPEQAEPAAPDTAAALEPAGQTAPSTPPPEPAPTPDSTQRVEPAADGPPAAPPAEGSHAGSPATAPAGTAESGTAGSGTAGSGTAGSGGAAGLVEDVGAATPALVAVVDSVLPGRMESSADPDAVAPETVAPVTDVIGAVTGPLALSPGEAVGETLADTTDALLRSVSEPICGTLASLTGLAEQILPDLDLPDLGLPDLGLPDLGLPGESLPELGLPGLEGGSPATSPAGTHPQLEAASASPAGRMAAAASGPAGSVDVEEPRWALTGTASPQAAGWGEPTAIRGHHAGFVPASGAAAGGGPLLLAGPSAPPGGVLAGGSFDAGQSLACGGVCTEPPAGACSQRGGVTAALPSTQPSSVTVPPG